MAVNVARYLSLQSVLGENVTLIAVSKMRTAGEIMELFEMGHRDFGENYVQELVEKHLILPESIRWHYIGHLQSNKVKYIIPFVHLIHGVDSFKLLLEINRQGKKLGKVTDCLLQVHIASEKTKHGLNEAELDDIVKAFVNCTHNHELDNIRIRGLMGMATFTDDKQQVDREFKLLRSLYEKYAEIELPNFRFTWVSMGMSDDYTIALANGSNMVRIGSMLFGSRPPLI